MTRDEAIVAAGMVSALIGAGDRLLDEVDWLTRCHPDGLSEHVEQRVDELLRPHLRRLAETEERTS